MTTTGPPQIPERPGDAFSEAKRLIIARTGHFYFADKDDVLLERIRRRMRARGLRTLDEYLALLQGPSTAAVEWEALEAEITVGETFFFRFAEQFTALRTEILPAILEANAASRRVRVWSAGCSNGAEAYSVGILLHDLLGPALPDWRITLIGTDISAQAVASARAAVFGAWALRGMPPTDRDRYFVPEGSGRWLLRRHYRAMVRFQQHNLMSLLEAPPPVQFTDFDLILCRNVLIYFHPDTAATVSTALAACLAPQGWILFGHAEAGLVTESSLAPVQIPATMVYRGGDAPQRARTALPPFAALPPQPEPAPPAVASPSWTPLLPPPGLRPEPSSPGTASLVPDSPAAAARPETAIVEEVRTLADRGDIDAAVALCGRFLVADPMSARLHFYEGMLLHSRGANNEALAALRRAVYLRKEHALAHYYLGLVLIEVGQKNAGRRAIDVAARLASQAPSETLIEDGDGMTAGDLSDMARHFLHHAGMVVP